MPKFVAKFDNDPYPLKKGDVIDVKELEPGLVSKFDPYNGSDAPTETEDLVDPAVTADLQGNVSREDLKKKAIELGIDYAPNIQTNKLQALVDAKLAEGKVDPAGGETTLTAAHGDDTVVAENG